MYGYVGEGWAGLGASAGRHSSRFSQSRKKDDRANNMLLFGFVLFFLWSGTLTESRPPHHWDYLPTPGLPLNYQLQSDVPRKYTPDVPQPGSRFRFSSAASQRAGIDVLAVFGGFTDWGTDKYFMDLWALDPQSGSWTSLEVHANQRNTELDDVCGSITPPAYPGHRRIAGMVAKASDPTIVRLYGGLGIPCSGCGSDLGHLADLWEVDMETGVWSLLVGQNSHTNYNGADGAFFPGGRRNPAVWGIGDDLIMFGDHTDEVTNPRRTWRYSSSSDSWSIVLEHSFGPTSTDNHLYWANSDSSVLYLCGRIFDGSGQLWKYDVVGNYWTMASQYSITAERRVGYVQHPGWLLYGQASVHQASNIAFIYSLIGFLGCTVEQSRGDMWMYDMNRDLWIHIPITEDGLEISFRYGRYGSGDDYPQVRGEGAMALFGGETLALFGGHLFVVDCSQLTETSFIRADTWVMDIGFLNDPFVCSDGQLVTEPESACGGHGKCYAPMSDCVCDPSPYSGSHCEIFVCADGNLNVWKDLVCNGQGTCAEPYGACICNETISYAMDEECAPVRCIDGNLVSEFDSVCSGHGTCFEEGGVCVCEPVSNYRGDDCSVFCVDGQFVDNSSHVCSGRGNCSSDGGACECFDAEFWGGSECNTFVCEDRNPVLCSGHGGCSSPGGSCECDTEWGGEFCSVFRCFDGHLTTNSLDVCSGNGNCEGAGGQCICTDPTLWGGPLCGTYVCRDGNLTTDSSVVCNGHGTCSSPNGICECDSNWGVHHCSVFRCADGNWVTDLPNVCSGHGRCSSIGSVCLCTDGFDPETDCRELISSGNEGTSNAGVVAGVSVGVISLVVIVILVIIIVLMLVIVIYRGKTKKAAPLTIGDDSDIHVELTESRDFNGEQITSMRLSLRQGSARNWISNDDITRVVSQHSSKTSSGEFVVEIVPSALTKTPVTPIPSGWSLVREHVLDAKMTRKESVRMSTTLQVRKFSPLKGVFKFVIFELDDPERRQIRLVHEKERDDEVIPASSVGNVDMALFDDAETFFRVTLEMIDGPPRVFEFGSEDNRPITQCMSCILGVK